MPAAGHGHARMIGSLVRAVLSTEYPRGQTNDAAPNGNRVRPHRRLILKRRLFQIKPARIEITFEQIPR